jgi:endonuclease/exonuclease/phosphatase family metal-dependent hydrolase
VETLERIDADVIALQEVWQEGEIRQADLLADQLGFEVAYVAHPTTDDAMFEKAILSRWPIDGSETLAYEAEEATEENHLAIRADIDGPRGPVQMYSTHLNWRLDHRGPRKSQVSQLCRFVAESRPRSYPAIVRGDFNADTTSDEIHDDRPSACPRRQGPNATLTATEPSMASGPATISPSWPTSATSVLVQEGSERRRVDVATRHDARHLARTCQPGHRRRRSGGSSALGHYTIPFEEVADRRANRFKRHNQRAIQQRTHEWPHFIEDPA